MKILNYEVRPEDDAIIGNNSILMRRIKLPNQFFGARIFEFWFIYGVLIRLLPITEKEKR